MLALPATLAASAMTNTQSFTTSSFRRVCRRALSALRHRSRDAVELTYVVQGVAAVLTSLLYFKQKSVLPYLQGPAGRAGGLAWSM